MKHNGFGPHDNLPRHRLIQTYNWVNFKGLVRVAVIGLVILAVLVCVVEVVR